MRSLIMPSSPRADSVRQMSAVRRSCHTRAGPIGAPGVPVPEHGGLPLVGDPDGGDPRRADPRLRHCLARRGRAASPRSPSGRAPPSPVSGRSAGTASGRCPGSGPSGRRRGRASSLFPGPVRGCRGPSCPRGVRARKHAVPRRRVPGEHAESESPREGRRRSRDRLHGKRARRPRRGRRCRRTCRPSRTPRSRIPRARPTP